MKTAPTLAEASPYKSVAEELETFRRVFREVCQRYAERIEAEIGELQDRVIRDGTASATKEKSARAGRKQAGTVERFHDLRDMLTLLRTLQVKPAEGRRKDLKKMESVVEELRVLSKGWA